MIVLHAHIQSKVREWRNQGSPANACYRSMNKSSNLRNKFKQYLSTYLVALGILVSPKVK